VATDGNRSVPRKPDISAEIAEALEEFHLRLRLEPSAPSELKMKWYREVKVKYGPRTCNLILMLLEAHVSKNQIINYINEIDEGSRETDSAVAVNPAMGSATRRDPLVVITLHGIKTRGVWQKELIPILHDAGYKTVPLDYGNFLALQLIIPSQRQKKIDWFRDKYDQVCDRERVARPSVIAHSFGTYLVARAMQKYSPVKFDRVIFCGAIVQKEYPWNNLFSNDQIRAVLNDFGRMDFWAGIVTWCVADAGASGREGFSELADGKVSQIEHPEFHHGDYFFIGNYKDSWIPFLIEAPQREIRPSPKPVPNLRFRAAAIILMVVFAIALFFVLGRLAFK
jgi:hypothetical protein